MLTDSRGSRAIIQVNSIHDTSNETNIETSWKIASNTEYSGIPSHFSTAAIGAA